MKDYIGPLGPISWKESDIAMLQSGFWAAVQKCTEFHQGIHRTFITGVTHLNQFTSDFDISMDLSLHQDASTMCGLTESEVLHTLQCICSDENKVNMHFNQLKHYTSGYHFCKQQTVQKMYNTRLAIWYFDVRYLWKPSSYRGDWLTRNSSRTSTPRFGFRKLLNPWRRFCKPAQTSLKLP